VSADNVVLACHFLELDPRNFLDFEAPNPKASFGNSKVSQVSTSALIGRIREKSSIKTRCST